LLLYRWTGSAWVEISGGGGTVTGAFNGCQEQANEIGLGGQLSEATDINTKDFPISFNADETDTAQFLVINDVAISELAVFTSINAFNDGGVYIGNFETFGTIQSKEYAGQTPTELRLNYDGGNIQLGNGDLGMYFDFNTPLIQTTFTNNLVGLKLDFDNKIYNLGDYDNYNNGMAFSINDDGKTINTIGLGSPNGLLLNFDTWQFNFGDYNGNNNGSSFGVDDDQQTLTCTNVTSLDPGASIVGWIKIIVDSGYYVLPYYNI